jgi:hypothetical protein
LPFKLANLFGLAHHFGAAAPLVGLKPRPVSMRARKDAWKASRSARSAATSRVA